MNTKTILIAISGGISAYKVADVISGLKASGYIVRVMTTKNALNFITPTVIGTISGNYITNDDPNIVSHIVEAQNCDAFICVPATANIMAKFAHGIADDFVTSTFIALPKETPRIICPAMNTKMYESVQYQFNEGLVASMDNTHIISPVKGLMVKGK